MLYQVVLNSNLVLTLPPIYKTLKFQDSNGTSLQVFITAGAGKGSSNMRQAVKQKEDHMFAPNLVFNEVETKDKVTVYYTY
jgi:hypothetical protein